MIFTPVACRRSWAMPGSIWAQEFRRQKSRDETSHELRVSLRPLLEQRAGRLARTPSAATRGSWASDIHEGGLCLQSPSRR